MTTQIIDAISNKIQSEIDIMCSTNRVIGASIGITYDQDLIWNYGFGYADLQTGATADQNTLYRIASITKTFTATAIFQLRDEGHINLDDPLTKYIPEFGTVDADSDAIKQVTLRRLLCHHSGLVAEAPASEPFWSTQKIPSVQQIIENMASVKIVVSEDTFFKYSNLGFALLGEVISRVTGSRYEDYITTQILNPLGMTSTTFSLDDDLKQKFATGYQSNKYEDSGRPVPDMNLGGYAAAGQLYSSVNDLSKWASFQFSAYQNNDSKQQILSNDSLKEMHRPRIMDPNLKVGYCLPWIARRISDNVIFGHTGFTYGFRADLSFDMHKKLAVVALLNTVPELPPITNHIFQKFYELSSNSKIDISITKPVALIGNQRDILGLYVNDLGLTLRVEYINSTLSINLAEGTALGFAPGLIQETEMDDVFVACEGRWIGENVVFKRDNNRSVHALDLGPFRFTKLIKAKC